MKIKTSSFEIELSIEEIIVIFNMLRDNPKIANNLLEYFQQIAISKIQNQNLT